AVSGGCDGSLLLWDLEAGSLHRRLVHQPKWIVSVAFAPDGQAALFGSLDGTLRLWNVTGSAGGLLRRWLARGELRRFVGHTQSVTSVRFDPSGRWAVSGSMDKTVRVWDVATGANLHVLTGHGAGVTGVALAPDGRHVLSGSMDKTVRWWDLAAGREAH